MNQTRTFLIFAWMMVAVLLWMEWGKEQNPAPAPVESAQQQVPPSAGALPGMEPGNDAGIPSARPAGSTAAPVATVAAAPIASDHRVTITSDVLKLSLDGGNVYDAELLKYPQTREEGSPPVKLLDDAPAHYYIARSGWTGQGGATVPELVPEDPQRREIDLVTGEPTAQVSFVSPPGSAVRIRRTYTLSRGSYAIAVHDEVINESGKPWQGYVYRQLARIPPDSKGGVGGMTNPESYSFAGAKWFSAADGYEGRKYDDFIDDGPLDK